MLIINTNKTFKFYSSDQGKLQDLRNEFISANSILIKLKEEINSNIETTTVQTTVNVTEKYYDYQVSGFGAYSTTGNEFYRYNTSNKRWDFKIIH